MPEYEFPQFLLGLIPMTAAAVLALVGGSNALGASRFPGLLVANVSAEAMNMTTEPRVSLADERRTEREFLKKLPGTDF